MRQLDYLVEGQVAAQNLVEEAQRGDKDGRNVGVVSDLLRIESVETVHAAEKQFAATALVGRTGVELVVLQSVGCVVVSEGFGRWIEARQAANTADPEIWSALFRRNIILQDAPDLVAWQPILNPVVGKSTRFPLNAVETSSRANPKLP